MTCKGYDPRAVKLPKSVKRASARIVDNHARGALIRSFVEILVENSRAPKKENSK